MKNVKLERKFSLRFNNLEQYLVSLLDDIKTMEEGDMVVTVTPINKEHLAEGVTIDMMIEHIKESYEEFVKGQDGELKIEVVDETIETIMTKNYAEELLMSTLQEFRQEQKENPDVIDEDDDTIEVLWRIQSSGTLV